MATRYIVQRPLKVGDTMLQPGAEVPAAAAWRNLSSYVASGHIAVIPEAEAQVERIDALEQRIAELEGRLGAAADSNDTGQDAAHQEATPHLSAELAPPDGSGENGAGTGPNVDEAGGSGDRPNLKVMKRADLEAYATTVDIEHPDDRDAFPNVESLIAAIEARLGEQAE